jgi:drug/metabolite transporter (DMT)-like permease
MNWALPLVLSAALWAIHIACIRIGLEKLPAVSLVATFYIFALLTTLAILFVTRTKIDFGAILADRKLLVVIAGAGITIGLVDYLFSKGLGAPGAPGMAIYSPLFTTIGLILIAMIGVLAFQESLSPIKIAGLVLSCIGIFLLAR